MVDTPQSRFEAQGYPGAFPRWTAAPASDLAKPPYNRICQVEASHGGHSVRLGSGWLVDADKILTAAHVVVGATAYRVRFAPSAGWLPAILHRIAPGYMGLDGRARVCSASDIALLRPPPSFAAPPAAAFHVPIGSACAIGFLNGVLVHHTGTATPVGPFLGHNADTDHGHSGGPVFAGDGACSIHVGLFSESRRYLAPPLANLPGFLNSAVRIDAALMQQLLS